ncbi:MAG TPA: hypothetical protein VGM30_22015 [Puia sp.]|jgi:hypothetical protein
MMQKELLTKKDHATVGEKISHEQAADFILGYDKAYPNDIKWFSMGKNALEQILAQPGCAGIRFYNGINEKGQKTLVYVGMDANGKDLVKKVVVQQDGSVAEIRSDIFDRNDTGFDLLTWIFGW